MYKAIIILLFLTYTVFGQVEQSKGSIDQGGRTFDIDVAAYPTGNPEKTRLDVFIKIPFSNIQFVRSNDGFTGNYSVTLTFYDEYQRGIILERFWNEKVVAKEFSEAISNKNYNYDYRTFEFEPGKYYLRCEVLDKDSKKGSIYQGNVTVRKFDSKIQLSDLIFISNKIQQEDGPQYVPLVSNIITSKDSSAYFIYEVHSEEPSIVSVEYIIVQEKTEETIYSEITDEQLQKGTTIIEHKISNADISLGSYNLIVRLRNDDWDIEQEIKKTFKSRLYGFPESIVDLDKAIEQMIYIAGASTLSEMEDVEDYDKKLELFEAYWDNKDPNPNVDGNEILQEYYRRVAYANVNFKNYFEGWRTDMGMIYIVLGPPNNVERHPFDLDSKPYEIWDYYDVNKRFIFVDQTGFGDYRLLNNQYGDWYRYRP